MGCFAAVMIEIIVPYIVAAGALALEAHTHLSEHCYAHPIPKTE
jgi:hypothetical protein